MGNRNEWKRRLEQGERWWAAEVALRAAGLGLLAAGGLLALWLIGSIAAPPPHHAARMLDYGAALALFLCGSGGSALLTLGPGLFRLVPLPRRTFTSINRY